MVAISAKLELKQNTFAAIRRLRSHLQALVNLCTFKPAFKIDTKRQKRAKKSKKVVRLREIDPKSISIGVYIVCEVLTTLDNRPKVYHHEVYH